MIICEECGARNRNGAYVCEECGASLLHLEATEDDFEPVKRKAPLFGRKARPVQDEIPVYDEDEPQQEDEIFYDDEQEAEEEPVRERRPLFGRKPRPAEEEPEYSEDEYAQDEPEQYGEEKTEEEPMRVRRPLLGRKSRPAADEPEYAEDEYAQEEPQQYEEEEPDEGPVRVRRPLFGRKSRPVEDEPEYSEDEQAAEEELRFVMEEPEAAEPESAMKSAVTDEPAVMEMPEIEPPAARQGPDKADEQADETFSVELEEPEAEETAHIAYEEPVSVRKPVRVKSAEPEPEEAPSSITLDMEVQRFDDEEDYEDDDDGYDRVAPVYKTDYKAAYQKSVRGESDRMTRGMIAAILTVSSLLVVTLVVLGVLMIGKNNRTAPVIATKAPMEVVTPAPEEASTPSPAAEPTPSSTPVPTTPPEEDFGSVFDQPTDGLLPDANQ